MLVYYIIKSIIKIKEQQGKLLLFFYLLLVVSFDFIYIYYELWISRYNIYILHNKIQYFIRAGKFPESFKLGKIRSFIDKSLNKMKKKENFWSFLF